VGRPASLYARRTHVFVPPLRRFAKLFFCAFRRRRERWTSPPLFSFGSGIRFLPLFFVIRTLNLAKGSEDGPFTGWLTKVMWVRAILSLFLREKRSPHPIPFEHSPHPGNRDFPPHLFSVKANPSLAHRPPSRWWKGRFRKPPSLLNDNRPFFYRRGVPPPLISERY